MAPEDGVPQRLTNVVTLQEVRTALPGRSLVHQSTQRRGGPHYAGTLIFDADGKRRHNDPEAAGHTIAAAAPVVGSVSDTEAEAAVAFQTSAEVNRPIPATDNGPRSCSSQTDKSESIVVGVLIVCAGAIAWWLTQPRLQPDPRQPTTSKTATTEGANPAKEASEYQTSEGRALSNDTASTCGIKTEDAATNRVTGASGHRLEVFTERQPALCSRSTKRLRQAQKQANRRIGAR